MPLTSEQRAAYGPDWPEVSAQVRDRSGGRCECDGECGWKRHNPTTGRCPAVHGEPSPFTGSKVVLTAAHLHHNPGNNDLAYLRAMCQGCHLQYDRNERIRRETCMIHNRWEASHPTDYRACRECGHVFRTSYELLTEHAKWGGPPETDPDKVWSCPLCAHDF